MPGLYFMQYQWDLRRIMPALEFVLRNHKSSIFAEVWTHLQFFAPWFQFSPCWVQGNQLICLNLFCVQFSPNWSLHVYVPSYDEYTYQSLSLQLKMHIFGV